VCNNSGWVANWVKLNNGNICISKRERKSPLQYWKEWVKAPQRRAPTVLGYVGTYPSLPHPHSENASTTQYKLHDKNSMISYFNSLLER
jgi:hypothetical protein